MRFILSLFALVIGANFLPATNYYVSSRKGNDANDGISPNTPFQTIAKVNSLTLVPGDSVLFACGNLFRGQLIIKQSGELGKPIVISRYGTGAPPCIKGSEVIDGTWTVSEGSVYKTFLEFRPWYVFVNENWHTLARTPNAGNAGDYFDLRNPASKSSNAFVSNSLKGKADVTGSYVTINTMGKSVATFLAKNFNASTGEVTVDKNIDKIYTWNESTSNAYGVMLSNQLQYLDQEREFYYDTARQTLYLETFDKSAPKGVIEGSVYDYGIQLASEGQKFVEISGIDFRQQKNAGIFLPNNNSNISISRCDFTNLSTAISVASTNNSSSSLLISYNLVQNAFKAGMILGNCSNTKIIGNNIQDCAPLSNMAEWLTAGSNSFSNAQSGIELTGTNVLVTENRIDHVAQSGIALGGNHNTVFRNEISNCALLFFSCGGISCGSSSGTLIKENILHEIKTPFRDVPGMFQGRTIGVTYPAAILVDNQELPLKDSLQFTGNIIYNCWQGVSFTSFVNASSFHDNTFYNIANYSILVNVLKDGMAKVTSKMQISRNRFYVLDMTSYAIGFDNNYDKANPAVNFAQCDSNSYYFASGEGLYELQSYNTIKKYCRVAEWKSNGYDQHSYFFMESDLKKSIPARLPNDTTREVTTHDRFQIFVNNTTQPENLKVKAKGYKTVEGVEIPEIINLPACSAIILRNDHPPVGNGRVTNGRG